MESTSHGIECFLCCFTLFIQPGGPSGPGGMRENQGSQRGPGTPPMPPPPVPPGMNMDQSRPGVSTVLDIYEPIWFQYTC